jgi:diguanylate cyclase (GGDEF)-like protein
MTLATITAVLLPITLVFILEGKLFQLGMAAAAILFFISTVRAGKILSTAMHQSFRLTHELKDAKEIAENLALIDELTGLNNRRAFYEKGHIMTNLSQRSEAELSMIVMDLDHFKNINDTLGHTAGDVALKKVGEVLKKEIRKSDLCARIGGEEFGILFQVASQQAATQLAEKLRKHIEQTKISYNGEDFSITGSFGVAVCATSLEKLFKGADQALYQAKESGRNCVVTVGCVID